MDQSYFQNVPNVVRILYAKGMKNIFKRTGKKFGISVTGIIVYHIWNFMKGITHSQQFQH